MTTPLSDERLALFRRWVDQFNSGSGLDQEMAAAFLAGSAGKLLDEVDRLRAENGRLLTELLDADRYVGAAETDMEMLRARVARLKGLLRKVEWSGPVIEDDDGIGSPSCPWCGWVRRMVHHSRICELDAALREDE